MNIEGRVWKFGDHVDTDAIIPAKFLNVSEKSALAKNCFADLRPEFGEKTRPGDILVAGANFGCGSSREHAPWAIKVSGIGLIIATSFARIFYRNAFNIGLPLLEFKDATVAFSEGNRASANLSSGELVNLDSGKRFSAKPIPDFMMAIVEAGGLVDYVKKTGFMQPG